ncbi:DUF4177 domain-containing protein [Luteimonas fraxinea]|jgi:hypothetical protein|uniref:DUF4177 domain-containing protein n=1 Tax=Luteimonas fraxinea TaxID=2901869 RepID=A0ABS8UI10_9GAMM|nr:DUF4177 domain-containing protein [Luteimonas fraxinea]MCD9098396.1 DUF4177 domain-containing protein [Luteimonas fraxinea]MCD9127128.1 DUF4177 domain-containing protein [Luteimonas fraxinea]UHH10508.1 DUF4177 domain-containing protein [Luteimonas fraxinea]
MSERWQYKVEEIKVSLLGGIKPTDIEARLQSLGLQGWELVNAVYAAPVGPTLLFLKRRA